MGEVIQLPVRTNLQHKTESFLFQEEPPEEFLHRLWDLLSRRPEIRKPGGNPGNREGGRESR